MLLSRQNRLLPALALVMGLIFVLVLQRACSSDSASVVQLQDVPEVETVDGDTPSDTLNTLTATVAAMTSELEQLRTDNKALREGNEALLAQRESNTAQLRKEVREALAEQRQASREGTVLSDLQQRLDAINNRLDGSGYEELPIGFGLTPGEGAGEMVWIEPLDDGSTTTAKQSRQSAATTQKVAGVRKVMTVPRNATLMGATAMTALLGRVPVGGEIRDPMPFKIITGRDNLAANGLSVPGVAGMIWSGSAIGDWTLSCVSGELHSVTYVFTDGTIRTISSDGGSDRQDGGPRNLGWLSDELGVPCISGERKSNAAAFLSQRMGSKAFEAAAEAAAAAQTTTVLRDSGAFSGAVTGNTGEFILGKTLAGGGAEVAAWLAERQAQSFDAVFVNAGTPVVIHVDRELAIDLDPNGRKLDYEISANSHSAWRLD
jgi:hypothetical protein